MTSIDIYTTLASIPHNIHQLNRYIKFINLCSHKNQNLSPQLYSEHHHILPKSIFPQYKSLTQFPINGVHLTARQHYICHWILANVFVSENNKHSMIKAWNRMHIVSKTHSDNRYISSVGYEILKIKHSNTMKLNNPMFNEETKLKAKANKTPWTDERKQEYAESRRGINNISADGILRLHNLWLGVPRPKTAEQIEKIVKSSSCGTYITPWGEFYSVSAAANSKDNIDKISAYVIKKSIKSYIQGYKYIPNGKTNTVGIYKRTSVHGINAAKACSCGTTITPWGEFYSAPAAFRDINNIETISVWTIKHYAKKNINGFNFIPNGKIESRGTRKK